MFSEARAGQLCGHVGDDKADQAPRQSFAAFKANAAQIGKDDAVRRQQVRALIDTGQMRSEKSWAYRRSPSSRSRCRRSRDSEAMMRTLLEKRFKLRVHREMRQMPVYALTVAREGRLGPNTA